MEGALPVSGGVDEVEAAVDAVVHDVPAVEAALIMQVLLKLVVYVLDDRLEAAPNTNILTFFYYYFHWIQLICKR